MSEKLCPSCHKPMASFARVHELKIIHICERPSCQDMNGGQIVLQDGQTHKLTMHKINPNQNLVNSLKTKDILEIFKIKEISGAENKDNCTSIPDSIIFYEIKPEFRCTLQTLCETINSDLETIFPGNFLVYSNDKEQIEFTMIIKNVLRKILMDGLINKILEQ